MAVASLLWLEIAAYAVLFVWMGHSVWRSSRGDRRTGDTARLAVASFSALLIYRDWRILYVDDSAEAKIIMCTLGVCLCVFTALAAKAYGRGVRI